MSVLLGAEGLLMGRPLACGRLPREGRMVLGSDPGQVCSGLRIGSFSGGTGRQPMASMVMLTIFAGRGQVRVASPLSWASEML